MASTSVSTKTTSRVAALQSSPILWTMLALIGLGTFFLLDENLSGTVDTGLPSLVALAAWLGFGLIGILIVLALQRYGHRPTWTVALALAWGALAATGLAQQANIALETIFVRQWDIDPHAWATTPIVEETLKGLGVMALALIPAVRFRSSLDGLFYGVIVGAGFVVCESFFYTVGQLLNDPGSVGQTVPFMILLRGVMGGAMTHPVYTGLIGAAIGYAVTRPDASLARRALVLVPTAALAILLHSIWNRQDDFNSVTVILAVVAFIILVVAIIWTRSQEQRRLAQLAPDFLGLGPLTQTDVEALKAHKGRQSRYHKAILRYVRAVDMSGPYSRATAKAARQLLAARG